MMEKISEEKEKLSVWQISLFIFLFVVIAASIGLSILISNNAGQEGYDSCVEKVCGEKGEEFCARFRVINSCCTGAGGTTGNTDGKYICVFN